MNKKTALSGFALFFTLALITAILKPFMPELDESGHYALAGLISTIGLWIFRPLGIPFSVSGILFLAYMLALRIPANVVFAGFAGAAVWTLIPALFFGFALAKTGLGRRIAYMGMKRAKLTYPGLLLMWMIIGIVLSALTPSVNVRVIIIVPIALNCAEILNIDKNSKERSLILLTAWAMAVMPGMAWLTGSLLGPALTGFFSSVPELGAITFSDWLKVSLLPIMLVSVLTVVIAYFVFKPKKPIAIDKEVFALEYKKLGPVSGQEKFTAIVLTASFAMFITNPLHHISDATVCIAAMFLLSAAGIIKQKDISGGINWDLVIFIGTAMGFSAIFTYSGIAKWLSNVLFTAISPLCINPWVFVFSLLIIMFLLRFIDIATFLPTIAIFTSVIPHIADEFNINPLVWIPLMAIAVNACFLSYQNMFALVAETNFKNNGWKDKHFTAFGCVYFVASIIAMLAAVPYWIFLGMF